jgi:HlyD family secretion protein
MVEGSNSGIFRAEALAARGRIEALPSALRVTSSRMRGVVAGLGFAVAGSIAASAYVAVPLQISGNGILIDRSGHLLTSLSPTANGFFEAILVRQGERVSKGQMLARLALPEQSITIVRLAETVEGLERDSRAHEKLEEEDRRAEAAIRRTKAGNLERQIESFEKRLAWLAERAAVEEQLLKKGISTETRAITARVAVQEVTTQRDQARFERASLALSEEEVEARRERERLSRKLRIDQAKLDLEAARRNLETQRVIVAPMDGIISDIPAQIGTPAAPGRSAFILTAQTPGNAGASLEAAIFVQMAKGKQISVGDTVLLSPASLYENEHDRIRGVVRQISGTASTRSSILALLGSEQLADLAGKQGPVFQLIVELERDPAASSGLAWTSGKGPGIPVTRGTPVSAKVTVEHVPLISLALPALRTIWSPKGDSWVQQRP